MNYASKVVVGACAALLLLPGAHPQSLAVQELYQQAHEAQDAGDSEKAVTIYRELLRKDPTVAAAYNNLGRLLFNLNRFSDAAQVLQKGIALKPDMAPAQVMLGASYVQLHEPAKAVEPLQRGVKALPDDHFARQMLVQALVGTNRTTEAVAELQRLVQIDTRDQKSWYLLGKLELKLSEDAFAHMRAIDVNSALSHQLSGEIMESMQNNPGAIAEYRQALVIDPNDTDVMYRLANIYWSTGDSALAAPALSKYLEKRPGDCNAEWKLANTMVKLGSNADEAFAHASAAVKACPDSPQARVEHARALLQQNKASAAVADLNNAAQNAPADPSVQFLLARAYHALGKEADATTAMARFKELDRAQHEAEEKHAATVLSANQ